MIWVKVCGLTRTADVEAAEEAGADAIGLVLVASSPRRIDAETAARLAGAAPIETILLVADVSPAEMLDLAGFVGATGIQPYGAGASVVAEAAVKAGLRVLRPVPVETGLDLSGIPADQVPLLDRAKRGVLGGTGERFDPALVGRVDRRWVMAGGLDPDNVADAIRTLRPWGVDASSGLESAPGVKDPNLIRRYVEEAKQA